MIGMRVGLLAMGLMAALSARAATWTTTGFASLIGGMVTSGSPGDPGGAPNLVATPSVDPGIDHGHCPYAIGNWPNIGVYDRTFSLRPESRAGLQENVQLDNGLNFVGEATARLSPHQYGDLTPDWLYAGYNLTPSWTLQAGRKRLPIFMYSDYVDIGYDYPWMRPPGDLYGWQIDHYNGLNLLYNNTIADVSVTWNLWTGSERDNNNEELTRLYYDPPLNNYGAGVAIRENWYNMLGSYVDISKDWWEVRAVYMQNQVTRTQAGYAPYLDYGNHQKFRGISVNLDPGHFVLRSEFNEFMRPSNQDYYHTGLIAVGYHIGQFLPMLTYSSFHEDFLTDPQYAEIHFTRTATLRWDFRPGMDLKVQYDDTVDHSHWNFLGNSKLLTAGWDMVF